MGLMAVEPVFKPGDYIINRKAGDIAIVGGTTKKGYYTFKQYYGKMFDELKDLKNLTYEMQFNYQKFWDYCTEDEKAELDEIIRKRK